MASDDLHPGPDSWGAQDVADAFLALDEVMPPVSVPRASLKTRTPRAIIALIEVERVFGVDWSEHVL